MKRFAIVFAIGFVVAASLAGLTFLDDLEAGIEAERFSLPRPKARR